MNFDKLTSYLQDELYAKSDIPGCDLAVTVGHDTVYRAQFGYADISAKTPVSADSQYYLFSCTKPITVTSAMRLVESGALDLEADAAKYLPCLADAFLLKDGVKCAPASAIKVKNLFTMTAGFNYNIGVAPIKELLSGEKNVSARDLAAAAVRSPLDFEPGERFKYSLCHDVLAGVVEAVTDMPFGDYLGKVIFEPLGMERTGFLNTLKGAPDVPPLYEVNAKTLDAQLLSDPFRHGLSDIYQSGGAGLVSCVEDYVKFSSAMACEGEAKGGYRILRPETVRLMRSEQLKNFALNDNFSCAAGAGYGYGLGVRTLISKEGGQRSPLGEFGWDGAAGSYVMIDTTNGVSIFYATHLCKWPSRLGTLHAPIRDLVYDCLGL